MESESVTIDGEQIYKGHLSVMMRDQLGLPTPYYSFIKNTLEHDLHCIEQQKRGGGTALSEWRLLIPPDRLLFEQIDPDKRPAKSGNTQMLLQSVASLSARVLELERQVMLLTKQQKKVG